MNWIIHENHLVPSFRRLFTFLTKAGIDALDMTQSSRKRYLALSLRLPEELTVCSVVCVAWSLPGTAFEYKIIFHSQNILAFFVNNMGKIKSIILVLASLRKTAIPVVCCLPCTCIILDLKNRLEICRKKGSKGVKNCSSFVQDSSCEKDTVFNNIHSVS